jgi:hypothetical protein
MLIFLSLSQERGNREQKEMGRKGKQGKKN